MQRPQHNNVHGGEYKQVVMPLIQACLVCCCNQALELRLGTHLLYSITTGAQVDYTPSTNAQCSEPRWPRFGVGSMQHLRRYISPI